MQQGVRRSFAALRMTEVGALGMIQDRRRWIDDEHERGEVARDAAAAAFGRIVEVIRVHDCAESVRGAPSVGLLAEA